MRLWTEERDDLPETNRTCCGIEAVEDAQEVANKLGIPYYLLNYERSFKTNVVDYFVDEYSKGRTPNPCLACNQYVKFDALLQQARALGADYLATGHYARIDSDARGYRLYRVWILVRTSRISVHLGARGTAERPFPSGRLHQGRDPRRCR